MRRRSRVRLKPTAKAVPGKDVTEDIRRKARELGFGEVGFTQYDHRQTYTSKKRWAKYEHVICLALEQDYVQTQSLPAWTPSLPTSARTRWKGHCLLDLADYIRTLGYHAQVHSPNDNSAPYIPVFVAAGSGQLGANGQLLSPHFGSRARLALITTDAVMTYDEPVDYGIHKFCQTCQVCVDRCPGRAIVRDKVWWRGVEKNKLIYERCRPVMARYDGCAVCMKTCPIQRFGMQTGDGSTMSPPVRYWGKVRLCWKATPSWIKATSDRANRRSLGGHFFEIPHGRNEEWLFHQFKEKLLSEGMPSNEELVAFAQQVQGILDKGNSTLGDE